jgi:flagellar hook assembly protein FlgD
MDVRVDAPGIVKVSVYNVAGQRVALLLNEWRGAGNHRLQWDGKNGKGAVVGNGTYLVVIEGPTGRSVKKVIVLK